MPDSSPPSVTELLQAWSAGDQQALGRLVPMVYADLRRMAKRRIASERECVPEPSSLVNELYVRLAGSHGLSFRNRIEFFGLAAQLLRRILVDAARARGSSKRGGGAERITFEEVYFAAPGRDRELVALDDALEALARVDARKVRAVELRFFGGLSMEETADAMEISVQTVGRDWKLAKAWLAREMKRKKLRESDVK